MEPANSSKGISPLQITSAQIVFILTGAKDELIDSTMHSRGARILKVFGAAFALTALVWCVFGQTLGHQFINFDDESYVYANPIISRGLSWPSIGWAFTHVLSHNWHPLTALSHMLDCQVFDLRPGGHHLPMWWSTLFPRLC